MGRTFSACGGIGECSWDFAPGYGCSGPLARRKGRSKVQRWSRKSKVEGLGIRDSMRLGAFVVSPSTFLGSKFETRIAGQDWGGSARSLRRVRTSGSIRRDNQESGSASLALPSPKETMGEGGRKVQSPTAKVEGRNLCAFASSLFFGSCFRAFQIQSFLRAVWSAPSALVEVSGNAPRARAPGYRCSGPLARRKESPRSKVQSPKSKVQSPTAEVEGPGPPEDGTPNGVASPWGRSDGQVRVRI